MLCYAKGNFCSNDSTFNYSIIQILVNVHGAIYFVLGSCEYKEKKIFLINKNKNEIMKPI